MSKNKMNPVVHFEMPYENDERIANFYTKAFGWKTTKLKGKVPENDYTLAATTESDEKGGPKKLGTINGGFYLSKKDWPEQHPSVVIAVDDIKESMKMVSDAGGKVLGEPMMIQGYGLYVAFKDTEGNRVSMMQPDPSWIKND